MADSTRCQNVYKAIKAFRDELYANAKFTAEATKFYDYHDFGLEEAQRRKTSSSLTSIKGPVWGTVPLSLGSSQVLDLPFVQRLRFISHTGIAKFYFPGASFSTLDHAVGTHYVLSRMLTELGAGRHKSKGDRLDDAIVSHAAILRNIATPPFGTSMISALLDNREGSSINIFSIDRREFFEIFDRTVVRVVGTEWARHASRHRIVSAALLLAEQFRTYYDRLLRDQGSDYSDTTIDLVAAVLGLPFRRGKAHYGDLLYSGLGAAQLDFLFRISEGCGFKVSLDLDRVVENMALREVSSAEIVNGLSHLSNFSDDKGSTTIAVLSNSDSVISREVRDSYVQRFRRLDTQPAITYLSVLFRQMIEDSILSVDRNPIDGNHEFSDVVLDFEHNILSQISNNELGRAAHVGKQFLFRQLGRKAFKLSRPLLDVGAPPFLEKGSSGYDAIDQALRDRTFEEFKQAMVKRDWRKNLEGKIIREATDIYHTDR